MSSLLYQHPKVYLTVLKIVHGKAWNERFNLMANLVGKKKTVLDIGCGTGILKENLDKSCTYFGIDNNQKFVTFAKSKNIDVTCGNIFQEEFPKADVVVISDVLHHVTPKHTQLIKKCLKAAPRLIICEPRHSKDFFSKISSSKLFFNFIGDFYGFNAHSTVMNWDYSGEELKNLLSRFGLITSYDVGNSLIIDLQRKL